MDQYNQKTNKKDIPEDCLMLNMGLSSCTFADDEDRKNIKLQLYDGGITKHWYWGNMAFELSSMKLAKKKIPILSDHDTSQRIGFSTSAEFDDTFMLSGRLLDNDKATAMKSDMDQGFPFESSLRFDPERTDMEFVKEGNKIEANGKTLKGPGVLFKNTVIMEGSVVTFGALNNCSTELFNKEPIMADQTEELTAGVLNDQNPEVFEEIRGNGVEQGIKEGKQESIERIKEFKESFGDDPVFCLEQIESGVSFGDAMKAYCLKLKTALANKPAETTPTKEVTKVIDPATNEFSDDVTDETNGNTNLVGDAALTDEFNKSAELQSEFLGDVKRYIAFKNADGKGLIHMKRSAD